MNRTRTTFKSHIFDPLEMRHSYTSKAEAKQNGLAVGHRHWFSLPFAVPDLPIPQRFASVRPAHLQR